MSTEHTRKLLRRQTWTRRYNLFAAVVNIGLFVLNVAAGNWLALLSAILLVAQAITLRFQTKQIRYLKGQLRPRPDYAAIARMERDVWGEAFGHAGAPASLPPSILLARQADPEYTCLRCGTSRPAIQRQCPDCYRERREMKTMRTVRAEQIMELRRAGHSQKEIAEELGLAPQTIRHYLMGEK